jgi:DNA-damage-inducible protein D
MKHKKIFYFLCAKNFQFLCISKATFGKTVDEYKQYKGLKKGNLRDHMNDFELIFTMLGEKMTTEITKDEDAKGIPGCKIAAHRGGKYAGKAKTDAEIELGRPITSSENYLDLPEKVKRKKLK